MNLSIFTSQSCLKHVFDILDTKNKATEECKDEATKDVPDLTRLLTLKFNTIFEYLEGIEAISKTLSKVPTMRYS